MPVNPNTRPLSPPLSPSTVRRSSISSQSSTTSTDTEPGKPDSITSGSMAKYAATAADNNLNENYQPGELPTSPSNNPNGEGLPTKYLVNASTHSEFILESQFVPTPTHLTENAPTYHAPIKVPSISISAQEKSSFTLSKILFVGTISVSIGSVGIGIATFVATAVFSIPLWGQILLVAVGGACLLGWIIIGIYKYAKVKYSEAQTAKMLKEEMQKMLLEQPEMLKTTEPLNRQFEKDYIRARASSSDLYIMIRKKGGLSSILSRFGIVKKEKISLTKVVNNEKDIEKSYNSLNNIEKKTIPLLIAQCYRNLVLGSLKHLISEDFDENDIDIGFRKEGQNVVYDVIKSDPQDIRVVVTCSFKYHKKAVSIKYELVFRKDFIKQDQNEIFSSSDPGLEAINILSTKIKNIL